MTLPLDNNDFDKIITEHYMKGLEVLKRQRKIRIGVLDIETTDLNPMMGDVLCTCIKEVNPHNLRGKIHTVRIDDKRNPKKMDEKWVIKESIKLMNSFDCLVHWYGSRFDIPYINTKALGYGLKPPAKNFRRDLCFIARGIGKLPNNRLATWGRFLFGKSGKTFLDPDIWKAARKGNKKAIKYIVTHCEKDVIETERIYKLFMPTMGKLKRR